MNKAYFQTLHPGAFYKIAFYLVLPKNGDFELLKVTENDFLVLLWSGCSLFCLLFSHLFTFFSKKYSSDMLKYFSSENSGITGKKHDSHQRRIC